MEGPATSTGENRVTVQQQQLEEEEEENPALGLGLVARGNNNLHHNINALNSLINNNTAQNGPAGQQQPKIIAAGASRLVAHSPYNLLRKLVPLSGEMITSYLRKVIDETSCPADVLVTSLDLTKEFRAKDYPLIHLLLQNPLSELISMAAPRPTHDSNMRGNLDAEAQVPGFLYLFDNSVPIDARRQDSVNWFDTKKMNVKLIIFNDATSMYKLKNNKSDEGVVVMRRQTWRADGEDRGWRRNEYKLIVKETYFKQSTDGRLTVSEGQNLQDFPVLVHYFWKKESQPVQESKTKKRPRPGSSLGARSKERNAEISYNATSSSTPPSPGPRSSPTTTTTTSNGTMYEPRERERDRENSYPNKRHHPIVVPPTHPTFGPDFTTNTTTTTTANTTTTVAIGQPTQSQSLPQPLTQIPVLPVPMKPQPQHHQSQHHQHQHQQHQQHYQQHQQHSNNPLGAHSMKPSSAYSTHPNADTAIVLSPPGSPLPSRMHSSNSNPHSITHLGSSGSSGITSPLPFNMGDNIKEEHLFEGMQDDDGLSFGARSETSMFMSNMHMNMGMSNMQMNMNLYPGSDDTLITSVGSGAISSAPCVGMGPMAALASSIDPAQKIDIRNYAPEYGPALEYTKMLVSVPGFIFEPHKNYRYSLVFEDTVVPSNPFRNSFYEETEVPAHVIAPGLLEAYAPPHKAGIVFFWVACTEMEPTAGEASNNMGSEKIREDKREHHNTTTLSLATIDNSDGVKTNDACRTQVSKANSFLYIPIDEIGKLTLAWELVGHHDLLQRLQHFKHACKELDLSNNNLVTMEFLEGFHNLHTLILDNNHVTHTARIPHLPKLHTLCINHNWLLEIDKFMDNAVDAIPSLRYLSTLHNPACPFFSTAKHHYYNYRIYILSRMRNLTHLDSSPVTMEEWRHAACIIPTEVTPKIEEDDDVSHHVSPHHVSTPGHVHGSSNNPNPNPSNSGAPQLYFTPL